MPEGAKIRCLHGWNGAAFVFRAAGAVAATREDLAGLLGIPADRLDVQLDIGSIRRIRKGSLPKGRLAKGVRDFNPYR